MEMNHYGKTIDSPVGPLTLVANDNSLVAVLWEKESPTRVRVRTWQQRANHPVLRQAERQLREYFARKRREFDLPLEGYGTAFQQRVWRALAKIPFGRTWSYGELARKVGSPGAARAVGAANGRNPLSVVIPCHRVIGADGKLTGFAGGLKAKQQLLALERGN